MNRKEVKEKKFANETSSWQDWRAEVLCTS